jgi:hypothetical protein
MVLLRTSGGCVGSEIVVGLHARKIVAALLDLFDLEEVEKEK